MYKIAIVDKTSGTIVDFMKHPMYEKEELVICNYQVAESYVIKPIYDINQPFMKVIKVS
jgi:hypothetical protein